MTTTSTPRISADRALIEHHLDELFSTIETGYLSVWTLETKLTDWFPVDDRARAADTIAMGSDAGQNVYVGMGVHPVNRGSSQRGDADGVCAVPGLYADIDFATDQPAHKSDKLPTVDQARTAITAMTLPPTMIVGSGYGFYPLWLFHEGEAIEGKTDAERAAKRTLLAQTNKDWQALLKRKVREVAGNDVRIDPTADLARVLRPVGAVNRKDGCTPVRVELIHEGGPRYSLSEFEEFLPASDSIPRETTHISKTESERGRLDKVLAGCPWLQHTYDNAATLTEPEWFAGMSIVANCRNGQFLAHDYSSPYPNYSPDETRKKATAARAADKPVRCASVAADYGGERFCQACSNRGTITSPIELGTRVEIKFPHINGNGRHAAAGSGSGGDSGGDNAAPDQQTVTEDPIGSLTTDRANAERFARQYGDQVRYCKKFGTWFVWDGGRWAVDVTDQVVELAKRTVLSVYIEAADSRLDKTARTELLKHGRNSEQAPRILALLKLAQSAPGIAILPDAFDQDPNLLNCRNGTVDLRDGSLRDHNPADMITKLVPTAYTRTADCPRWKAFLAQTFGGDSDLPGFAQRAAGYSLFGEQPEHAMLILHGAGRNGKGTMVETMRDVIGPDYAAIAPTEMLLSSRESGIPNDLARLRGVRLVTTSETAEGRRLDESKIKAMTGGDTMTARFMRGEWFDFRPVFTIWLSTNHRPVIRGTDDGIWSRLRLIPFDVRFYRPDEPQPAGLPPDRIADLDLGKKLRSEASGILRWMVEGAIEWKRRGSLDTPAIVRAATENYRTSEDQLGEFIAERCVLDPNAEIASKDLYAAFVAWSNDTKPMSESTFGKRITERGIDSALLGSGKNRYRARFGIRLRTEFDDVPE